MSIPARILRAAEQDRDRAAYALSPREAERHERIVACARHLMARHGAGNIAFRDLATALRMATATLRFHFTDLHALLGEILRRHLQAIATDLGSVPHDAPDRQRARRAAYLAYTRSPFGGLTEAHLLLVRDRCLLPDDERDSIELTRDGLGSLLAGELGCEALLLLDEPTLDAARIENRLVQPPAPPLALPWPPAADEGALWSARAQAPRKSRPAIPRAPPIAA